MHERDEWWKKIREICASDMMMMMKFEQLSSSHKSCFKVTIPIKWVYHCGVTVKATDCRIVVSKFEQQSHYYIHFQTNTLGKGMNPLIPPAMVWTPLSPLAPLLFFKKDGFDIK